MNGFTLSEANIAPEHWWLTTFLLGGPIFRGYLSFRESQKVTTSKSNEPAISYGKNTCPTTTDMWVSCES